MPMATSLVTGSTGFIGSEIVRALLHDQQMRIILLIRHKQGVSPEERFKSIVKKWDAHVPVPHEWLSRIAIVPCDLTKSEMPSITEPVDFVFHAAASTDFDAPLAYNRLANVDATRRVIELARTFPHLKRFVFVSTAFACGRLKGRIREQHRATSFNNSYEQSKFEAEDVVRQGDLPYTIVRPSVVVGNSDTGYTLHFRGFYSVARFWFMNVLPAMPVDLGANAEFVPVDYVVQATLTLSRHEEALNETFHLCNGRNVTKAKFVVNRMVHVFNIQRPRIFPPWVAKLCISRFGRLFLDRDKWLAIQQAMSVFGRHLPYLWRRGSYFDMGKTDGILRLLGVSCPPVSAYVDTMSRFCRDSYWGKKPTVKSTEPTKT